MTNGSRKMYQALAQGLADWRPPEYASAHEHQLWAQVVGATAGHLSVFNERFDYERFVEAAGFEPDWSSHRHYAGLAYAEARHSHGVT